MKVIVKIEQYLPDTEQITFRICGLHSHKKLMIIEIMQSKYQTWI